MAASDVTSASLEALSARLDEVEGYLHIDERRAEVKQLEQQSAQAGFWDDAEAASAIMSRLTRAREDVAAIDGARGMEIVLEWSKRYKKTPIIWITSDPDFAGMAIRRHIFDFIIRPYTESRFRDAVREAIRRAPRTEL